MGNRKDLNKRKGSIFQKLINQVLGERPPNTTRGYIEEGNNVAQWTGKFDDTPLDGDRYVNGTCCTTVGEYKAALAKNNTDMGGWSG